MFFWLRSFYYTHGYLCCFFSKFNRNIGQLVLPYTSFFMGTCLSERFIVLTSSSTYFSDMGQSFTCHLKRHFHNRTSPWTKDENLNVHKGFRRHSGRLSNVLCTFTSHHVCRGMVLVVQVFRITCLKQNLKSWVGQSLMIAHSSFKIIRIFKRAFFDA